jgi:hypothetical protein
MPCSTRYLSCSPPNVPGGIPDLPNKAPTCCAAHLDGPAAHLNCPAAHLTYPAGHLTYPPARLNCPAAHPTYQATHLICPAAHLTHPAADIDCTAPHLKTPAAHLNCPAVHLNGLAAHLTMGALQDGLSTQVRMPAMASSTTTMNASSRRHEQTCIQPGNRTQVHAVIGYVHNTVAKPKGGGAVADCGGGYCACEGVPWDGCC